MMTDKDFLNRKDKIYKTIDNLKKLDDVIGSVKLLQIHINNLMNDDSKDFKLHSLSISFLLGSEEFQHKYDIYSNNTIKLNKDTVLQIFKLIHDDLSPKLKELEKDYKSVLQ